VSSATGNTDYVQIPESVLANGATPVIPANAFQNDDLVKGFDFLGAASTVPSVGTGAFTCNLAACVGTPWVKSAYHDEANSTNWTDGNTWNSDMVVRTLPTFSIAGGPAVALDRKHAKLVTALTSNSSGSITVVATAKIKVGRTWRLRTVCTKTVAITAGATLPTICTAGATARASIRLQKVKFRLSYTFTQTNTERVVLAASSVTVKRAR
jgi:hypothetical protein